METTIRRLAIALALAALLPEPGSAQSLWQRRDPERVFLFYDTQARRVGDLLTIIIREDTNVANKEQRLMNKETTTNAKADFSFSAAGIFGNSDGTLTSDDTITSDRTFGGNATFSSARQFTDRVTVQVLDVLPNGNLVVGGRRSVIVENDVRTLVVSGIVRQWDVSPDNTVLSSYVSQLDMHYEGRGTESKFVNQGWLGRAVNWLWPF